MKLNRALQLEMLTKLAEYFPAPVSPKELGLTNEHVANLAYLAEHGLVEASFRRHAMMMIPDSLARITAAGMDFLADDGGITAIRGVVTIKFHQDALRELIELRLADAPLPKEEKGRLLQSVRELPADSIKHLTTKLLDLGLDNLPQAVELIRRLLG